jgi:hypothetical protein
MTVHLSSVFGLKARVLRVEFNGFRNLRSRIIQYLWIYCRSAHVIIGNLEVATFLGIIRAACVNDHFDLFGESRKTILCIARVSFLVRPAYPWRAYRARYALRKEAICFKSNAGILGINSRKSAALWKLLAPVGR